VATAAPQPSVQDPGSSSLEHRIAASLEAARRRTLALVEGLSDDALNAVHDQLMSPIVWDLGHIANFEELWLVQRVGGCAPMRGELGSVYDAFTAPRRDRGELPYLRGDECFAYMDAVRERALDCLSGVDLANAEERLLAGGFIYELIARHERQHTETILQTLQIIETGLYSPARSVELPEAPARPPGMVLVGGGEFELGAPSDWFAYDNERPGHTVELEPFWIDAAPVTNGEFADFVEDGGYRRPEWWSSQGWQWRERESIELPRYWRAEADGFAVRAFDELRPLERDHPVCHVSWYEADAYARSLGKRLPAEPEWEKAASWDATTGSKRRFPWGDSEAAGRANLDQLAFGTAPVGAYPGGASAVGAHQMMGDVWEWTGSVFEAYEGFEAFPYREYSEVFFGGPFKVLRGGSWATQPGAVTTAFRNWDYPERRQIFAGFRCARDAREAG
jgi:gamma-glutamyl hercynylcysteine S-oxide synthase